MRHPELTRLLALTSTAGFAQSLDLRDPKPADAHGASQSNADSNFVVTTTANVEGFRVTKYLGMVHGVTVRQPTIGQDFKAGFESILGGKIRAYTCSRPPQRCTGSFATEPLVGAGQRFCYHICNTGGNTMASSFRLDPQLEWKLAKATEQIGCSRSEIIRLAVDKYCEEVLAGSEMTPYERLMASGFEPLDLAIDSSLSGNKRLRREKLRERAIRDNH